MGILSNTMKSTNSAALSVLDIATAAKNASTDLALTSGEARNRALLAMAQTLRENVARILEANKQDLEQQRAAGMKESLLDRLALNEERIDAMASALEDLTELSDPIGVTQQRRTLYNGIELERVSVPLGLVAMVYEARPNVTVDAAGICIKSGNACVLRGGSAAQQSNIVLGSLLHEAACAAGMPEDCICVIETTDRSATDELISLHGIVDVLIPRGGAGLIRHCVEHAKVPVIETGTGNCHTYVHQSADFAMAREIILNGKTRRTGVCNTLETLLVDEALSSDFLPLVLEDLSKKGVFLHLDDSAFDKAAQWGIKNFDRATQKDWAEEYLGLEIAVKCVSGEKEAVAHINQYGTKHSEAIVTQDISVGEYFCKHVDAAAVYVNASTAFTDGAEFGMGAEIGISTQKLHARGPFALEALTSYKYILHGNGQVRA